MSTPQTSDRFIYESEVRQKLGNVSQSAFRNWIKRGAFPDGIAPIPKAKRRWRESTVDRWIDQQEAQSTGGAA